MRQSNLYREVVAVAKLIPGVGNPLLLSMSAFRGIVDALSEESKVSGPVTDHRAHVEREMSRIHGNR